MYEEIEASKYQGQVLSPVFSVFDPIGLFLTQQHCENKVEPGKAAKFLELKEQLRVIDETCVDRKYFNGVRKLNFKSLLTHLKTPCVH